MKGVAYFQPRTLCSMAANVDITFEQSVLAKSTGQKPLKYGANSVTMEIGQ